MYTYSTQFYHTQHLLSISECLEHLVDPHTLLTSALYEYGALLLCMCVRLASHTQLCNQRSVYKNVRYAYMYTVH